ncbi:MAG: FAD-dependent oxidoreductase [Deltaproteobacteria bacterium]|nr:FAD-dependent oxidoreductase [Deltaproteobacteria bacterium]
MSRVAFRGAADLPLTPRSQGSMLWNHTGSWRYLRPRYQDKVAPCSEACPAGEDIALIELLAGQGAFEQAWLRIREENPLPGVCGRVCYHPCEAACNRREYDDAVSVSSLERYLADHAWTQGLAPDRPGPEAEPGGCRVAVVGAGPAGLTAAYHLRRRGCSVALFDAREEPGGMLRYGIPEYRLPADLLAWEAGLILGDGVTFHPGRRLGEDLAWDELGGFEAVFVAVGAWTPTRLEVPGAELCLEGLEILEAVRRGRSPEVGGPVAVIGGGNTALDVARTLLRLGAEPEVFYRRRAEDMPALADEVREAREEGITVRTLLTPERVESAPKGGLRLTLSPQTVLDVAEGGRARVVPSGAAPVVRDVTAVVSAIGVRPSKGLPAELSDPARTEAVGLHLRRVRPDAGWAARPPVFLGGDLVNERRAVVTAIASGKEAAVAIGAALAAADAGALWPRARVGGRGAISLNRLAGGDRSGREDHVVGFGELNTIYFAYQERRERPRITRDERRTGFDEVGMRISGSMALREAERCFHCGLCDQCDNCYLFCPDVAVRRDLRQGSRQIDYDYCKGCGVCVVECPRNAMLLEEEPR